MKIKDFGQVFTPLEIVNDILDASGYKGEYILKKYVIDNSCGDGAFLVAILNRYIEAYKAKHNNLTGIEEELREYIHGIEIDPNIYEACLENVNNFVNKITKNELIINKH